MTEAYESLLAAIKNICNRARHSVLARMGDKWTILVMSILAISPETSLRFSAIENGIPKISQRMLALTLRTLNAMD